MFKHKKLISAILAVAMLGAMSTSVFAEGSDTVSGYLNSCGDVGGYSLSWEPGGTKYVKSETTSMNTAYRLHAKMAAVNRNTGATLASGVQNKYNEAYAGAQKTVKTGTSVTVYGTHEVWGTASEYWGEYTTVYD